MSRKISKARKLRFAATDKAWHATMMAMGSPLGRDNRTGALVFVPWDHVELINMALMAIQPEWDVDLGKRVWAPDCREMRLVARRRNAELGFVAAIYGLPI